MSKTEEIMNIEEQENNVTVTDVTCVEAEEKKSNSDFVVGAVCGVLGAFALKGVVSFIGWCTKKAKAKKAEAQKQSKDDEADEVITPDEEGSNGFED